MFRAAINGEMVRRFAVILPLSTLIPVLVVVAAAALSGSATVGALWLWLALGMAAALLCAGVATVYLARRYRPGLAALRDGFQELAASGFAVVPAVGHDEVQGLIGVFNRCAERVRIQHAP